MIKLIAAIFLASLTAITLTTCGGGGGSGDGGGGSSDGGGSNSGDGNTTTALEIKAPMSDPPVVLGGQQTTITLSAFVTGSSVELFRVDGSNLTKIGDMTDDGRNGGQTAGDKVYTIQTTVNESTANNINFRISASSNNTQSIRDITIPVWTDPHELDRRRGRGRKDISWCIGRA